MLTNVKTIFLHNFVEKNIFCSPKKLYLLVNGLVLPKTKLPKYSKRFFISKKLTLKRQSTETLEI